MINTLKVKPLYGLCNRLRVLASINRLLAIKHVKNAAITWDWGNIHDFFEKETISFWSFGGLDWKELEGQSEFTELVLPDLDNVTIKTCHPMFERSYFKEECLSLLKPYVPKFKLDKGERKARYGFHIRAGDNNKSKENSPVDLFIEKAKEINEEIFLASDSLEVYHRFRDAGVKFIYNKNAPRDCWPFKYNKNRIENTIKEFIDLKNCEIIIGSYWSSFSEMAILLNGNPESAILRN